MNTDLLKLIDKIKATVRDLDDEGIVHPLIDKIYDQLAEMEDIIYQDEESNGDDSDSAYFE
jgi:hypothetical protein